MCIFNCNPSLFKSVFRLFEIFIDIEQNGFELLKIALNCYGVTIEDIELFTEGVTIEDIS